MKKTITTIIVLILMNIPVISHAEEVSVPDKIASESVLLMDAVSGQVLYEKNAEKQLYPASLTKIATAIYAIENGNMDDMVEVSEKARAAEGTRVYLEPGEQVTLEKLVQGLLINSGNDAGIAIAEHLEGSVQNFAKKLNDYLLTEVGVTDTHFTNPHGLFNTNHFTTAYDLAKITQYAMVNGQFREIIGTEQLDWIGESWVTTLYHHHKMMREIPYEGITGGKTGFVDESGHTLMTTANRDNISLIVIALNGELPMDTYKDTEVLLDYGFDNFETKSIAKGTEYVDEADNKYVVSDALYYSQFIDEEVQTEMGQDGELKITTSNPLLAISFPLDKVDVIEKSKKVKPVITKQPVEESKKNNNLFLTATAIIVAGLLVILAVRRLRR
jgi:serine-type D-Ala-D-Ala carboxypeptidase (penicillin-binding protein 5/6)